ncbi:unnamed protein product [Periconia digitata]|uniref:Uncharacterized protein n=1 Tax=Periconia digitata TaxID=1303443 RepID=A0A9W4UIQ2_9PLEO|nr:unnamed protein product [Periconia digitata]
MYQPISYAINFPAIFRLDVKYRDRVRPLSQYLQYIFYAAMYNANHLQLAPQRPENATKNANLLFNRWKNPQSLPRRPPMPSYKKIVFTSTQIETTPAPMKTTHACTLMTCLDTQMMRMRMRTVSLRKVGMKMMRTMKLKRKMVRTMTKSQT